MSYCINKNHPDGAKLLKDFPLNAYTLLDKYNGDYEKLYEQELVNFTQLDNITESGKLTQTVKLFKGLRGKRDINGKLINPHEGAKGVFATSSEKIAKSYAGEEEVANLFIPAGTTVKVVKVEKQKGQQVSKYRAEEVEKINESDADVVKLITTDKQVDEVQYIIKNESILETNGFDPKYYEEAVIKTEDPIDNTLPPFEAEQVVQAVKTIPNYNPETNTFDGYIEETQLSLTMAGIDGKSAIREVENDKGVLDSFNVKHAPISQKLTDLTNYLIKLTNNKDNIFVMSKDEFKKLYPKKNVEGIRSIVLEDGKIFIFENSTEDIQLEEVLHPVIIFLQKQNPQQFEKFLKESKNKYPDIVESVNNNPVYKNQSKEVINNEIVTKSLARALKRQENYQNKGFFKALKDMIQKIFDMMFGQKTLEIKGFLLEGENIYDKFANLILSNKVRLDILSGMELYSAATIDPATNMKRTLNSILKAIRKGRSSFNVLIDDTKLSTKIASIKSTYNKNFSDTKISEILTLYEDGEVSTNPAKIKARYINVLANYMGILETIVNEMETGLKNPDYNSFVKSNLAVTFQYHIETLNNIKDAYTELYDVDLNDLSDIVVPEELLDLKELSASYTGDALNNKINKFNKIYTRYKNKTSELIVQENSNKDIKITDGQGELLKVEDSSTPAKLASALRASNPVLASLAKIVDNVQTRINRKISQYFTDEDNKSFYEKYFKITSSAGNNPQTYFNDMIDDSQASEKGFFTLVTKESKEFYEDFNEHVRELKNGLFDIKNHSTVETVKGFWKFLDENTNLTNLVKNNDNISSIIQIKEDMEALYTLFKSTDETDFETKKLALGKDSLNTLTFTMLNNNEDLSEFIKLNILSTNQNIANHYNSIFNKTIKERKLIKMYTEANFLYPVSNLVPYLTATNIEVTFKGIAESEKFNNYVELINFLKKNNLKDDTDTDKLKLKNKVVKIKITNKNKSGVDEITEVVGPDTPNKLLIELTYVHLKSFSNDYQFKRSLEVEVKDTPANSDYINDKYTRMIRNKGSNADFMYFYNKFKNDAKRWQKSMPNNTEWQWYKIPVEMIQPELQRKPGESLADFVARRVKVDNLKKWAEDNVSEKIKKSRKLSLLGDKTGSVYTPGAGNLHEDFLERDLLTIMQKMEQDVIMFNERSAREDEVRMLLSTINEQELEIKTSGGLVYKFDKIVDRNKATPVNTRVRASSLENQFYGIKDVTDPKIIKELEESELEKATREKLENRALNRFEELKLAMVALGEDGIKNAFKEMHIRRSDGNIYLLLIEDSTKDEMNKIILDLYNEMINVHFKEYMKSRDKSESMSYDAFIDYIADNLKDATLTSIEESDLTSPLSPEVKDTIMSILISDNTFVSTSEGSKIKSEIIKTIAAYNSAISYKNSTKRAITAGSLITAASKGTTLNMLGFHAMGGVYDAIEGFIKLQMEVNAGKYMNGKSFKRAGSLWAKSMAGNKEAQKHINNMLQYFNIDSINFTDEKGSSLLGMAMWPYKMSGKAISALFVMSHLMHEKYKVDGKEVLDASGNPMTLYDALNFTMLDENGNPTIAASEKMSQKELEDLSTKVYSILLQNRDRRSSDAISAQQNAYSRMFLLFRGSWLFEGITSRWGSKFYHTGLKEESVGFYVGAANSFLDVTTKIDPLSGDEEVISTVNFKKGLKTLLAYSVVGSLLNKDIDEYNALNQIDELTAYSLKKTVFELQAIIGLLMFILVLKLIASGFDDDDKDSVQAKVLYFALNLANRSMRDASTYIHPMSLISFVDNTTPITGLVKNFTNLLTAIGYTIFGDGYIEDDTEDEELRIWRSGKKLIPVLNKVEPYYKLFIEEKEFNG
jgi:hypothetical protein